MATFITRRGLAPLLALGIFWTMGTLAGAQHQTRTKDELKLMKAPNIDVAKAISFILVQAKYKPAMCNGAPCPMEFPFRFNLTL